MNKAFMIGLLGCGSLMALMPAHAGFLDKVNNVLNTADKVLDTADRVSNTSQRTQQTAGKVIGHQNQSQNQSPGAQRDTNRVQALRVQIAGYQIDKINKALSVKTGNFRLDNNMNEAKYNVSYFLQQASCADTRYDLSNYIGNVLDPNHEKYDVLGLGFPKFHPKNKCMTLQSIDSLQLPANNAISFNAIFVSDQSGEVVKRKVEIKKSQNGQWLALTFAE